MYVQHNAVARELSFNKFRAIGVSFVARNENGRGTTKLLLNGGRCCCPNCLGSSSEQASHVFIVWYTFLIRRSFMHVENWDEIDIRPWVSHTMAS